MLPEHREKETKKKEEIGERKIHVKKETVKERNSERKK
jgi:hypothetical protein